jgi:hypothetical protein
MERAFRRVFGGFLGGFSGLDGGHCPLSKGGPTRHVPAERLREEPEGHSSQDYHCEPRGGMLHCATFDSPGTAVTSIGIESERVLSVPTPHV